MKLTKYVFMIPAILIFCNALSYAAIMGDSNGNGKLDVADAIIILQTLSGLRPEVLISDSCGPGNGSCGTALNLNNIVTTFAGSGARGSTDGTGTAASFSGPEGITTDGTNLFVADRDNHTVRKIVISSGVVTTVAGTAGSSGSTDGTGTAARFNGPAGITTDGTNLFVAERFNHTIRKIVISSGVVTTVAGTAGSSGSTDGTGTAASFNNPYGIATDGTNLFAADVSGKIVRKIVISTGVVTTIAGSAGVVGSTDGTGTAARFNSPRGIATDCIGLFVVDSENSSTIRRIQ